MVVDNWQNAAARLIAADLRGRVSVSSGEPRSEPVEPPSLVNLQPCLRPALGKEYVA